MSEVHSGDGLGIYGISDVLASLQTGIVDMVIVADNITKTKLEAKCNRCGYNQQKIVERIDATRVKQEIISKPCPSCSAVDYEIIEKDIVDYLEELAVLTGSKLEVISGGSEEGSQISSLGSVGAILRFRPTTNKNLVAHIS
jgi:peptide chain release factor subunit 1